MCGGLPPLSCQAGLALSLNEALETEKRLTMNEQIKSSSLNPQQVAMLAYHLWESEGAHHGRDQEYWFRAEKQLKACGEPARNGSVAAQTAKGSHPARPEKSSRATPQTKWQSSPSPKRAVAVKP